MYFPDYFLLLLHTFLHKYLYFLLLLFSIQVRFFRHGGSPFDNKSIINHESVSLDWQHNKVMLLQTEYNEVKFCPSPALFYMVVVQS